MTGAPGQQAAGSLPSGVREADRGGAGLEHMTGGLSVAKSMHVLPVTLLFTGFEEKGIYQSRQRNDVYIICMISHAGNNKKRNQSNCKAF